MNPLSVMYRTIVRCIAPPYCYHCYEFLPYDMPLCSRCITLIKPVVSQTIALTPSVGMAVHALGAYEPPLMSMILTKGRRDHTAAKHLGVLLSGIPALSHLQVDALVPVPLHWMRYAWRGYNQAELISQSVAAHIDRPVIHAISRSKRTKFQSSCSGQEREQNVSSAFELTPAARRIKAGAHVLLIDDLLTTGATLRAAAKQLLALKPACITALVVCRTI